MTGPTTTIAQIGCGYWGPMLLRSFAGQPGCRIKWVADLRSERREFVRERFRDCAATDAAGEVMADPDVDAVVVATPAGTHFELAKQALLAGKHVLVEKPMATSVREARELAALAADRRRVLMVGHTFLYNPAIVALGEILRRGELGEIHYLYAQRLNLGQVRSDVNAWWNLAPHDVAILLWLRDGRRPASVALRGGSYLQPGNEDVAFGVLAWEDGVIAHVHVSWLDPDKVRRVTVVGSRKMAVCDDMRERKLVVHDRGVDRVPRLGERMDFDEGDGWQVRHRSGDIVLPPISGPEPLRAEAAHFLECLRTGQPPLTGPAHGVDVVAVLEAGERSLRGGGGAVPLG